MTKKTLFLILVICLAVSLMTISAFAVEDGIEAEIGHVLTYSEGYPASCHNRGLQAHWYCAECDVYYDTTGMLTNAKNLTIPADCELTHAEAVEAGCHSLGNIEHWYCEECGALFADAEGHIVTNALSVILPATGGEDIPVTGDYSMVIFFAIAVIAMAGVVVLTKKNFNV